MLFTKFGLHHPPPPPPPKGTFRPLLGYLGNWFSACTSVWGVRSRICKKKQDLCMHAPLTEKNGHHQEPTKDDICQTSATHCWTLKRFSCLFSFVYFWDFLHKMKMCSPGERQCVSKGPHQNILSEKNGWNTSIPVVTPIFGKLIK